MNAIFGIVLGCFLGYLLGRYAWWINIKFVSKNVFFKAFESELLVLNNEGGVTIYMVLRDAFDKHQLAINEFKRVLSERESRAIENAWQKYYKNPNKNEKRLRQYERTGNREESERRRKLALANIEKVLEFSKHKLSLF